MNTFFTYFNIADELDGGLTLEELAPELVAEAIAVSADLDLPWPPDLAHAEDYLNSHRDEFMKCEICGETMLPNQERAEMYHPGSGNGSFICPHSVASTKEWK